MNTLASLARYRALENQARQLEADAKAASPESAPEILRDAIATRARMLEIEQGAR